MTVSLKLKLPKKDPLRGPIEELPRNVWIYDWSWTLDPRARTKDIKKYKTIIMDYCNRKLSKFNIEEGTSYKPKPVWTKSKDGDILHLSVKITISPTPPPTKPGSGTLNPPPPNQPPPPRIGG